MSQREDPHRSLRSPGGSRSAAVKRLSTAPCAAQLRAASARCEDERAAPDEDGPDPSDVNPAIDGEHGPPGPTVNSPVLDEVADSVLIDAVRAGTVSAYGLLYQRHVAAAYNLARQLTRCAADADDLVAEAYAKVLDILRDGRGPDRAFRAYLLTAVRRTAYDRTRRARKIELTDDVSLVLGVAAEAVSEGFVDTAIEGLERSLAAHAFARLPERWQAVLWHTEIEGQSPAQVAPVLKLSANGVAALAYRAREALRQAYLQMHLAETTDRHCRAAAERLGAWTRDGLGKREKAQVDAHLDVCGRCRGLAGDLATVNSEFRTRAA